MEQDTLEIFCEFASERMVGHSEALVRALPSPLSFLMSVGAAPAGSLPGPHPNRAQVPPTAFLSAYSLCTALCVGQHGCRVW